MRQLPWWWCHFPLLTLIFTSCSTKPSFITDRFHHMEVSHPSFNKVHIIWQLSDFVKNSLRVLTFIFTFKVALATGHIIYIRLPLKLCPEETLSLQDGDMQTTPFLLHINWVITRWYFNVPCLYCTLKITKQISILSILYLSIKYLLFPLITSSAKSQFLNSS